MYSTLVAQEDIEEIPKSLKLVGVILLIGLGFQKREFYLLVRNPYKRLESFFKNKFRATLPNIVKNDKWQYCHEIFFPYLDLEAPIVSETVVEKLGSISFPQFISLLPNTYTKDGHLYPQYWAKKIHFKIGHLRVGIPIKYKAIFKMESPKDLQKMAELFHLDLSINNNSTATSNVIVNWSEKEYNIVNKLFKCDLEHFEYKIIENEFKK